MKANIVAILALSALTFTPVSGAPAKKMNSAKSTKQPAAETAAGEEKISGKQADARELVADLTPTQKSRMLTLLNEGSAEDLAAIKGISLTRAAALEEARPFEAIDEVVLVRGIGAATMAEIVTHARTLTTAGQKNPPTSAASEKEKS